MISVSALQQNNKVIYVGILSTLIVFLLMDYIPALAPFSHWVTPPVALFLGLIFALVCGQAHPKFNKKTSKYLLQYSVVGLGFGMNLQASLASGKEGMEFTILSVIGTMLIGMFIGRKILKIDRDTSYLISSGTAICGGSAPAAAGPPAARHIRAACRALNQLVQRAISTAGIQRRRGTGCRILAGCFASLTGILCDNNLRLGQLELAGRRLDPGHKLCACIPFSCNGVDEKYLFHRGAPSAQ